MGEKRVLLAAITGAHGVKGLVKLKSFTERPEDVGAYGPLSDEAGAVYRILVKGRAKGSLIVQIEGLSDRDTAAALAGTRLFVERDALPRPEDEEEFYHVDLIGLVVEDTEGRPIGEVAAVEDYGAGPVLEVRREEERPVLLPFTRAVVPVVDLAGGRLVVSPPEEVDATSGGNPPS
jgi:16S rRNA processing protein RimM